MVRERGSLRKHEGGPDAVAEQVDKGSAEQQPVDGQPEVGRHREEVRRIDPRAVTDREGHEQQRDAQGGGPFDVMLERPLHVVVVGEPAERVVDDRGRSDDVRVVCQVILEVPLAGEGVQPVPDGLRSPRRHQKHGKPLKGDVEGCGDFPSARPRDTPNPQAPADARDRDHEKCCDGHPYCLCAVSVPANSITEVRPGAAAFRTASSDGLFVFPQLPMPRQRTRSSFAPLRGSSTRTGPGDRGS